MQRETKREEVNKMQADKKETEQQKPVVFLSCFSISLQQRQR